VVLASFLLASCGGGGAGAGPTTGGPLQILPTAGTFYGGVEYTFTVAGGRPPYLLSASVPTLLQLPSSINGNSFSVIPANSAVIDTGIPPEALPILTTSITVRDAAGNTIVSGDLQIAQNFMTGYGVGFASNCGGGGATPPSACAGGETVISMIAAINGLRYGNREYRFEVVRGPFTFVNIGPNGPVAASGVLGPGGTTWTTRTDHTGEASALIRVNNNVSTQVGVFRVVDIATGASTQYLINISGVPLVGALTAIPDEFTLTGPNSAQCGTGSGDFLVFDGTPPYTAVSSFPAALLVEALDRPNTNVSASQPGAFRFTATNPFFCMGPGTIIVRDANNQQVSVEVTTEAGSGAPPPPPITATPSSLTLACGSTGSLILLGGSGTFTVSSPNPRITTAISGRILSITRTALDPVGTPVSPTPGTANPIAFTVNVTDGTNITALQVTAPSNCPP
jgi:hypothetical protein